MRIVVTGIKWDCHNDNVRLPKEVVVDDPTVVSQLVKGVHIKVERLTNYLWNKYGYDVISCFHRLATTKNVNEN